MADSEQQISTPLDQTQRPSLLADIVSDNYLLLMVAALLVLSVSLLVLIGFWVSHYGLIFSSGG